MGRAALGTAGRGVGRVGRGSTAKGDPGHPAGCTPPQEDPVGTAAAGAWAAAPPSARPTPCRLLRADGGHLFPPPCSGCTNTMSAAGTARKLEAFTPWVLAAWPSPRWHSCSVWSKLFRRGLVTGWLFGTCEVSISDPPDPPTVLHRTGQRRWQGTAWAFGAARRAGGTLSSVAGPPGPPAAGRLWSGQPGALSTEASSPGSSETSDLPSSFPSHSTPN